MFETQLQITLISLTVLHSAITVQDTQRTGAQNFDPPDDEPKGLDVLIEKRLAQLREEMSSSSSEDEGSDSDAWSEDDELVPNP